MNKSIFKVNCNADNTIQRLKACLVPKGHNQRVDYSETYSHEVIPAIVRLVLSLVIVKGWHVHRLDVKNALLNGELQETMFISQPPGLKNAHYPNAVCKLKKALYGLKQAP